MKRFRSDHLARCMFEASLPFYPEDAMPACACDEAEDMLSVIEPHGPAVGWQRISESHASHPFGYNPYLALADALWGFVHA